MKHDAESTPSIDSERLMAKVKEQPVERELRLAGQPDALQAVFDTPLMAPRDGQAEATRNLENSYFDTADHRLRARGLALRIRADGESYRQTLKAGDDAHAALLNRSEWETPLEDDQPSLNALPKKALKLLPQSARNGDLQKIFKTQVQRRTRELMVNGPKPPASRIEVALDLGEIETDNGALPIAELELELLEGQPQSLYQLALDLEEIAPLHLETRSKSSRAFDQIAQQPPCWQRTKPPSFAASDSVDDAMAAIFESCFNQWLANQAAAIDGRDSEGVHQMRISLRRLRSALSIFGELIPESQLHWLKLGAKQTINALGPARDWDVFQSDLLAPVIATRPDDRTLRGLRTKVETRRRANYRAVRKTLEGADYTRFALRFGLWIEERAWKGLCDAKRAEQRASPIVNFASQLLKRRHKQVLTRGQGFAELTVAERHQLRIALKKLRYAVEFFAHLFDKKVVKPFLSNLKKLQDDLGNINDVAVAETLLGELLTKPGKRDLGAAAGVVIGWHAHRVVALEPALVGDWAAFTGRSQLWA